MSIEAEQASLKKDEVHKHLGRVMNRIIEEKPEDAYSLVEIVSRLIKEADERKVCAIESQEVDDGLDARSDYVAKVRKLGEVPAGEDGAPTPVWEIPDFNEAAEMLSWAGVGFGELESYKIMCSLRRLAAKNEYASATDVKLRFWGKILGTEADYYVAEAKLGADNAGDAGDDEIDMEPPGQPGENLCTYWVTTDLCDDWKKLPHVKPAEILASRQIRKMVTGNLKAKVVTHPFFPGREEVLLRAMVARISADTSLCAKGFLKREDDEDPESAIGENPEFVWPSPAELLKKSSWTHTTLHILRNGRTAHKIPEEDDENEEIKEQRKRLLAEQEADPAPEMLRTLDEDKLGWVIKQVGDVGVYRNAMDPAGGSRSNVVTVLRSTTWPGAVSVARNGVYDCVYVGYGQPAGDPDFFPCAPPDVQDEPEDPGEAPEPQGTEEADAPEQADE